jgi:hypothetical protein
VAICHCTDCQTLSSSAFRIVVFAPAKDFRLLTGVPRVYVKTAESGNQRAQVFCPECGTALYAADVGNPRFLSLRTGAMRQRSALIPKFQFWCRSALPWLAQLPAIASFDKQPPIPH